MRKAFTMIELIFVIVILSIIAVVAVPRLAATRDDAEIAKATMNIQTLIADIGSYYTAQGKFQQISLICQMSCNPYMLKETNA